MRLSVFKILILSSISFSFLIALDVNSQVSRNEKYKIIMFLKYDKILIGGVILQNLKLSKSKLICLKTGSKATIIKHTEFKNVSYVKINVTMKFGDASFQILKTIPADEIEKEFKYY